MTVPAGFPGDEVPEEDWAEQAIETGPDADGEPPAASRLRAAGTREVNEADFADQESPVDFDDER